MCQTERLIREVTEPSFEHYFGHELKRFLFASYVFCSFRPSWGLIRRHADDLAIIVLDAELVCGTPRTSFVPTSTARSSIWEESVYQQTGVNSLLACLAEPNGDAEILVPRRVDVPSFRGLVFSDGSLSRWRRSVEEEIGRAASDAAMHPSFELFEHRGLGMSFPPDFPPLVEIRI
jgi:hypothetical protein